MSITTEDLKWIGGGALVGAAAGGVAKGKWGTVGGALLGAVLGYFAKNFLGGLFNLGGVIGNTATAIANVIPNAATALATQGQTGVALAWGSAFTAPPPPALPVPQPDPLASYQSQIATAQAAADALASAQNQAAATQQAQQQLGSFLGLPPEPATGTPLPATDPLGLSTVPGSTSPSPADQFLAWLYGQGLTQT